MERIGTAVIGVGKMGEPYVQALSQLPTAKLVAVCDIAPELAGAVSGRWGVPGYTDYREMLAKEKDIRAVCVCTSDQAHREPCVTAAEMGKHILVEKPLALTVEDGEAIIGAAHSAGVKLMVGQILRFDPRYAGAYQAVQEGKIGEPIHSFVRRNNILASGQRIQGRTSVLYFLGIHDIDFLLWCLKARPETVYAAGSRKLLSGLGVDDTIFAVIRFENGTAACVEASWALPDNSIATLDARLEIVGTKGAVYVDIHGQGITVVEQGKLDRPDTMYGPVVHGKLTGILRDEIDHFIACVMEDREPLISGESALEAVRIVAAAHRSLESGQVERVF
ncbi:MAG: Gfo/Idh/MocA family oxidoreductase [Armatimonadetes bacterium]|nr:Gfo/Idh/MocA family oxidoreductase [Armatimonadota bacterium]